jgi:NAD(P)-dependent dehydrogenase (short-subunit alcohol dehydrogenase family)
MNKQMEWTWQDGVAVITGAGGLLGRGMAVTLARAGMDLVLADTDTKAAGKVAEEIKALGRRVLVVTTDVADPEALESLADQAWTVFGKVNLLCNNAGIALLRPYGELTLDDWNRVLGINLMGVIHGIHAFLPRMADQGGLRHIVNTSSMSGVGIASLRPLNAPYVTAKFAIAGLTETLAPVAAAQGIGVSVLCPGMTVADPSKPMTYAMASAEWYRDNLLDPIQVAEEMCRGIEENRLHIFPHRAGLAEVEQRHAALLEGFRQAGKTSPEEKTRDT